MSSSPTSQQPSSTSADVPEDGAKNLVQILERLEKALTQQQVLTTEISSSPAAATAAAAAGPPPSKKVKNAATSSAVQTKTKKQLEEVFATVRDKLNEVSELLKQ